MAWRVAAPETQSPSMREPRDLVTAAREKRAEEAGHPLLQTRHMTITPYRAMAERYKADHLIRYRS
ncbi:hypothetical protein E4U51_004795 [Claviceps purpurea]|nr:hypothetical protein E4U51_004795 [Claviceps purpurea]